MKTHDSKILKVLFATKSTNKSLKLCKLKAHLKVPPNFAKPRKKFGV